MATTTYNLKISAERNSPLTWYVCIVGSSANGSRFKHMPVSAEYELKAHLLEFGISSDRAAEICRAAIQREETVTETLRVDETTFDMFWYSFGD